jgi:hypothetical protein
VSSLPPREPRLGYARGRAAHRAWRKHLAKLQDQRDQARHRREARRSRTCERKDRYPSQAAVDVTLTKRAAAGHPPLRSYACEYCGGYHLTKKGA